MKIHEFRVFVAVPDKVKDDAETLSDWFFDRLSDHFGVVACNAVHLRTVEKETPDPEEDVEEQEDEWLDMANDAIVEVLKGHA